MNALDVFLAGFVAKGVNPYAIHLFTEALKFLGRQKVAVGQINSELSRMSLPRRQPQASQQRMQSEV